MPRVAFLSGMPSPDIEFKRRPWRQQHLLDEENFKVRITMYNVVSMRFYRVNVVHGISMKWCLTVKCGNALNLCFAPISRSSILINGDTTSNLPLLFQFTRFGALKINE